MALRPFNEQELQILANKGYDISKYDGRPVEIPDTPTELPSAGGVAVRSAAASALPTLAGGTGFAGGMALGGALAPATGGLSLAIPLVMGMGGALGASKLAAKGQEALLPDSVKQTLAEDYSARPVASTLGGLATLPLGGFNPGKLGQIGAGLSGMGKVIARPAINLPLSIAEKQAALNMTAGGTIGAVQEGVMQPLEGREFDPASIALNAMIGGTFIRPNAIGRKLGFRGIPERTVDDPDQLSRTVGQHVEPEPVHELRQPTVNFTETQMEAMRRSTGLKQSGEVESQKINIKTGEEIAEKPKLVKSAKTSAKAMEKALAEDAPVLSRETDPDILNVLVKQGRLVEKPVEGEAPKLPGISSPLAEEVAGGLKGKGLSTSPSEQYVATLAQEVMAEQNIKVSLDGNLTAADGAPLKGTALLPNSVREVVLNPKLSTLDTLPHEGLHYFRTELEGRARSGDAEAQRLLTKWDEVSAEGLADYNQRRSVAGLKPIDAHEFAVSENGLEFVKQQFNLNKEGGMQKWWNDTKALFREKYSKNATIEDLRRAINFRFVNEQTKGQFVGAAQRDQPAGEGLTPEIFSEGEKKKGQAFQDNLQGRSLERIANAQDEMGISDSGDLQREVDQATVHLGNLARNQEANEGLVTKAEKMLRNPEASKLPFNKLGVVNGNQLLGSLKNQLAPAEWDMLKQAGIEKYLEGRVINKDEALKWVKENGPKVEIHSYGMEGKVSEAKREYFTLRHSWYDTLHAGEKTAVDNYASNFPLTNVQRDVIKYLERSKLNRYAELYQKVAQEESGTQQDSSPRATSAYDTVSAFNTREPMPEWTKSKEGKNVQRVDVVVPHKRVPITYEDYLAQTASKDNENSRAAYQFAMQMDNPSHNAKDLWQPDSLHENLPNTPIWNMIQYKTGPKGEKIAVIVENQGSWIQAKHAYESALKKGKTEQEAYEASVRAGSGRGYRPNQDHPLLQQAQRLGMKAAIEQAKKEGAEYIVVSDAETAMMSEQLDNPLYWTKKGTYEEARKFADDPQWDGLGTFKNANGEIKLTLESGSVANANMARKAGFMLEREAGFRHNYDTSMPKIAEELTGSKGERVSLGEHKNAFETDLDRSNYHTGEIKKQRSDLIFRNADGTPKTDVSGQMFPLQKVAAKLDSGDQFTLFNKHQGADEGLMRQTETPEFKKWFGDSKVVDGEGRPLVVYHGTGQIFTTFKQSKEGSLGKGIYFATDPESANAYTKETQFAEKQKGSPQIYPTFVSIKNPMFVDNGYLVEPGRQILEKLGMTKEKAQALIEKAFESKGNLTGELQTKLKNAGYDGIILKGVEGDLQEIVAFNPEQIKSATGNRGTFDATNPDIRYQEQGEGLARTDPSAKSFLPGLASALDKVEQKVSAPIAQAGRNWASRRDSYTGKMQVALSDLEKLNDKVVDSAMRKMRMVFRGEVEKPPYMSAEELQAVQILRDYYTWNVEERRANGQMIEGREAGKNPYYVPDTMNEQARYTLLETPNSPEARYLKKVWADYVMEESEGKLKREEVVNNINGYVDAMGSKDRHYTSINFGAARKAQGYGMPEVMRETSAKRALVSYGRRAANDMAFFKEIESNRPIAAALMIKDPDTGKLPALKEGDQTFHTTQEVKNMMSWITGGVNENSIRHPFITSASRLTNNLLLGAPTGLRDLAQVPVFNVPYMNKWSDLSNFAKGVLNFQKESRNALEYAARQPQIDKLAFNEISDSPNRLLSAIQKAATFARKGQGREALENLSRNISFSIGKEFARGNVLGAKAGHAPSKKFLERFGTLVEGDVTKMEGPALEHALNQIAKNVVDATQGTYGPTGLPNFTSEGQLAPFLALTKWSIEKSNTIFKDVVKPFYTGENRIPLLTYTLGSVLTGAGIQQLNEALSGKKGSDPMLEEALAKGDAEAISLQLATLMQLGTYMGIVGDSMKIAADVYKGKTPRNPLSFPLYSSAINSADMIADAMGAIQEGEDPVDILYHLSLDLMSQNVQNARVVLNRVEGEETARKESFRDVRVFEELEGKKGTDIPKVNRYKGMEAKEFKREKDVGEAAKMLPSLVSKAKGEAESLEELRMKLQSLKQNNYQTFPNPKTQPEAFKKYYQFLVKTQGEQEAQRRLADYLRQSQVNKMKSQLVPALP